eukprot:TRINITY_DN18196_c0_g1_i3.p1 TRINITY_DN18196_c0_g1~~TRINITY_DN18196_c0_g1_i3.p1  ORF type:complete len:412 (+),score=84.36 TRINITY_DN18196_c0_g1_i3:72-1307(+)
MTQASGNELDFVAMGESATSGNASRHLCGIVLIVLVACIWVLASQLIEAIFKDLSFDSPFFLTYFNTCGFSFWLLGSLCWKPWQRELWPGERLAAPPATSVAPLGPGAEANDVSTPMCADGGGESGRTPDAGEGGRTKGGVRTYLIVAVSVAPAWMLANYVFNVSLDYTSVASNSVLSTTSNLWTMFFSVLLLGEKLNPIKVGAVAFTIAGAAIVSMVDAQQSQPKEAASPASSWQGDALALFSAFMYGTYTILLKYAVPGGEAEMSMPLIFGFIGCMVALSCWPILIFLDLTHFEEFKMPDLKVFGFLALNALIGTNLSDVLWARALQLTSPLIATLGLSLTIPIGVLSDMALHGKTFGPSYLGGAALVLVGFAAGSGADHLWAWLRNPKAEDGSTSPDSADRCDGSERS